MPQEGTRRRKKPRLFDILIVPIGGGGGLFSIRTSRWKLVLLGIVAFLLVVAFTLAVLIFTPVALYVPIPNPELEQKYGHQIRETQERINALAEDVLILSDYNAQLRKALGEGESRDTSGAKKLARMRPQDNQRSAPAGYAAPPLASVRQEMPEFDGGSEGIPGSFSMVVTESMMPRSRFPLLTPTDGFVTQEFNPARNHFGMDFAGKRGTPIYAASEGHILFAGWTYDDGNMLIIAHGGGYVTVYKHTQALLKGVQAPVKRGEPVALLGTSGKTSFGPHLHFEVWKDGIPQDPSAFLLIPAGQKQ